MEEENKSSSGCLIILVIILVFIWWYGGKGHNWARKLNPFGKTWTLFLFTSDSPDRDYDYAQIGGYKSQVNCLEAGLDKKNLNSEVNSYQCGYDCLIESGTEICDKVCSKFGCRD